MNLLSTKEKEDLRQWVQTKNWSELNRFVVKIKQSGMDVYQKAKVMNQIIREAMNSEKPFKEE